MTLVNSLRRLSMKNKKAVFNLIKDELTKWKPKDTPNNIAGQGYNNKNVMPIASGSLPDTLEFDYVYVAPPITNARAVTTGSKGKTSTETYVIEIYTLRLGKIGDDTKIKTQEGADETYEFIEELLIGQGFIVARTLTDLNYNNANIARYVLNATKRFINI